MSDSAHVDEDAETESVRSKSEKRRSARVAEKAQLAQPTKLRPTHGDGEGSTSAPQAAAAKTTSKKGKKATEPQPEPEEEVQPVQPDQPQLPRDD